MIYQRGTIPERHQNNDILFELQRINNRLANMQRVGGEISDVKYDQDKKRWYAKYKENSATGDPFETDWLPWKSFSHGTISISMPPKVGMKATLRSPGGFPEQGYIDAHHNGPDTPSPSGDADHVVTKVQKPTTNGQSPDPSQTLTLTWTKDGATHVIGDTTHAITKDAQSVKTKNDSIDTETHVTKASQSHTIETQQRTVTAQTTTIKSATYSLTGKALINC